MLDLDEVMSAIGRWGGTLKFFPADPDARIGIAEQIAAMAVDEDQIRWLVARIPQLFTDWPGMLEVRAVFCTRYKARDSVEAALGSISPAFVALCSEENERMAQLSAPRAHQIAGQVEPVSVDSKMQELIERCARKRDPLEGVKAVSADEIERLKAIQNANRRESVPL
jgi:hypothetical protein